MKVSKRILILAAAIGLITVLALSFYLNNQDSPVQAREAEMVDVVVASSTIPAYTRINSDMLEVKSVASNSIHPEAASSTEELAGGISTSIIAKDEQVIAGKIVTDETNATFSFRVPEGMRAIAIPSGDISSVAGYISPEDRVDILVTYSDSEIDEETVTYTKFQNIEVLATGSLTAPKDDANREGDTMVVAVTPAQAEVLAYAHQKGTFHYTLRAPQDDGEVSLDSYKSENFNTYRER